MNWLKNLNETLDYIEENLTTEIDLNKLSKIAGCSAFHFQRMFSYMSGVSLSEYIRRRKMTLAVTDLLNNEKVIDVSVKYGYESPTSFNRAFQNIHGFAPSKAKEEGQILKSFPKITFTLSIKGEAEMNYKIKTKKEFRIVGVSKHYEMNIEENFTAVPKFWQETMLSGIIPKIISLGNEEPFGLLGVSTCMNGKDFDYYIGVSSTKELPEGMKEYIVPKCTWAVFECVGAMPNSIQNLQKRIVTEWLPSSGYEYANAPDIEVYFEGDQTKNDYKCEVWLPITKSKEV